MNSTRNWDEAQIHAHVDGELDTELAAQLEADCRIDAALADRVAGQRRLRSLLARSFDPVLQEPVPERLQAALRGPTGAAAVPIGTAGSRPSRPAWTLREWSALAASLVLGVLVGVIALRPMDTSQLHDSGQGIFAGGRLDAALTRQIAGESRPESGTAIIASFLDGKGRVCRTFSQDSGTTGLACRQAGGWRVEALSSMASATSTDQPDYRQAASTLSPAIIVAMDGLGAGDALTPEQERQLRDRRWQGAVITP